LLKVFQARITDEEVKTYKDSKTKNMLKNNSSNVSFRTALKCASKKQENRSKCKISLTLNSSSITSGLLFVPSQLATKHQATHRIPNFPSFHKEPWYPSQNEALMLFLLGLDVRKLDATTNICALLLPSNSQILFCRQK
jgi:hypothetical protein